MCLKMPKSKPVDLLNSAPLPPEDSPKAPILPESGNGGRTKKKGRTSLKIDLNPSSGAGLRI
jgi:hypothetical protein